MPTLPPWPTTPVPGGAVVLRRFRADDVDMARELATDPYVPLIGSLPPGADDEQAGAWIERQHARWTDGTGFSFAVADPGDDRALGTIGLHLRELDQGARPPATRWRRPPAGGVSPHRPSWP